MTARHPLPGGARLRKVEGPVDGMLDTVEVVLPDGTVVGTVGKRLWMDLFRRSASGSRFRHTWGIAGDRASKYRTRHAAAFAVLYRAGYRPYVEAAPAPLPPVRRPE